MPRLTCTLCSCVPLFHAVDLLCWLLNAPTRPVCTIPLLSFPFPRLQMWSHVQSTAHGAEQQPQARHSAPTSLPIQAASSTTAPTTTATHHPACYSKA